jgi:hypothetical protein
MWHLKTDQMWTLEKLNELTFNSVEENGHLDYKGAGSLGKSDGKKAEISKDVSAFANSDGGIIIYGLKEFDEGDKRHLPEGLDPIDGSQFSKEWLEQVINSTISPRITNITITPIQTDEPSLNLVVYVVEIPKGITAHQAKDKRYYRRFNFESQMMDDWEIKDIINRQTKTNIQISFEPRMNKDIIDKRLSGDTNFDIEFDIWAKNEGNKVCQYLDCFISGNSESAKYIFEPFVNRAGFEVHFSNEKERKITIKNDDFIIGIDRIPILPLTSRIIGFLKIKADFIRNEAKLSMQVATEDNSKSKIIIGKTILE